MKFLNLLLVLLLVLTTSGILHAADSTSLARSAGKLVSDSSFELNDKLLTSPILQSGPSKDRTNESTVKSTTTQQYRLANHGTVEFVIYDAWVELTGDIDNDDFYHNIKVSFDADVNIPEVESVYAILYLSYEDGPWQQFADTGSFTIYDDSPSDTYVVMSELIEGYPPGDYDVLIELYSDYHDDLVDSLILSLDFEDFPITLEDLGHDEVYDEIYIEEVHHVGGGSFSWLGLLMLGFLVMIKYRYFSSNQNLMPVRTKSTD